MNFRLGAKIVSLLTLGLLVVAIGLLVAVMYADPTRTKERIEALAYQKGIELDLHGDIRWGFYPDLQFVADSASARFGGVEAGADADIAHINIAIELFPLLKGDLKFSGFEIEGAEIDLAIADQQGANKTELDKYLADILQLFPETSIASLQLKNVLVSAQKANRQPLEIDIHFLQAEGLNSDGEVFPLDAVFDLSSICLLYTSDAADD